MRKMRTALVALVAMVMVAATSVMATGKTTDEAPAVPQEVTVGEYQALVDDLTSSDVPRTVEHANGQKLITFHVDGFEITLADLRDTPENQPNLGGGWGARGPYVTFNQVDQGALIAGGGAALAGAICLIPAVGQVACVAAAAIVAIGAYYLNEYGRCPGDLRVWVVPRVGECV